MKYNRLFLLSLLGALGLMTGCTGQMPYSDTGTDGTQQIKECKVLEQQLMKTDKFIEKVQSEPAIHAEELAYTLTPTEITQTSNKKRMLRDAETKKAALLKEHTKMGCKPIQKH